MASAGHDETIRFWDIALEKADFGKLIFILRAQIICQGMLIENTNIKAEEKMILLKNGALEYAWQRKEYRRGIDVVDKKSSFSA